MKAGLAARLVRLEQSHPTEAWPPIVLSYYGEPPPPARRGPCLTLVLHRPWCASEPDHDGVCGGKEGV